MMPKTSREESIPSLLRSGGRRHLVCTSLAVIDKVHMTSLGEPPGAELSRYTTAASHRQLCI
jgi:hypothetical protein